MTCGIFSGTCIWLERTFLYLFLSIVSIFLHHELWVYLPNKRWCLCHWQKNRLLIFSVFPFFLKKKRKITYTLYHINLRNIKLHCTVNNVIKLQIEVAHHFLQGVFLFKYTVCIQTCLLWDFLNVITSGQTFLEQSWMEIVIVGFFYISKKNFMCYVNHDLLSVLHVKPCSFP